VAAHGGAGGFGVAVLDGDEDGFVLFDGGSLADAANGAQAAGDAEVCEGIEDETVNEVAAGIGDGVMRCDVGLNGGGAFGGVFELLRIVLSCSVVARCAA
jgi:hypothetical protein